MVTRSRRRGKGRNPLSWLLGILQSFKRRRGTYQPVLEPLEDRTLPSTIFGSVWQDLVPDGLRASGEPGIAAVTATLEQNGIQIQQTLTSGSGDYAFAGLAPGIYTVGILLPAATLTFPKGSATQQVQVGANQDVRADFGVQAAPDLIANQKIANGSGVQQMPSVAVDPLDADHVVTVYMDYSLGKNGFAGIGVAVSHDGGTTWERKSVPVLADFNEAAGNPIVRFDDQGHFYISYMAATFLGPTKPGLIYDPTTDPGGVQRRSYGMRANNGVFVVRGETDAGTGELLLGAPRHVASHLFTGAKVFFETLPDLAIDTHRFLPNGLNNPNYGNLYVTWTRFYPIGQVPWNPAANGATDIMIAVSSDAGQSWTTKLQNLNVQIGGLPQVVQVTTILDPATGLLPSPVEGAGFSTLSHVSVGPEGDVYVSMFSGNRFSVFHSTDSGAHFTNPDSLATNPLGDGTLFKGLPFGREDFPAGFPRNSQFPINNGTLFNDKFRTLLVRGILADPARPGHVYAWEAVRIVNISNVVIDAGEINFARSDDYGVTWQKIFTVGSNPLNSDEFPTPFKGRFRPALNDDDGSRLLLFDTNLSDEVRSGQALPQFSIDAQGNLAAIWYDTRRDPANRRLDVYGAVSTDGGQTFSGNFRITDANFDPDAGVFKDARANNNFYLGDLLGLATNKGKVYAAWTDTRLGNQDIFFGRYDLAPAPLPFNDRFELNNTSQTAIDLGKVTAQSVVPRLGMAPGDHDWFRLEAGATGDLVVLASSTAGADLHLELFDAAGTTLLQTGTAITDPSGLVTGQQISRHSDAGQQYLVHVFGGLVPLYSLVLQSLTANLGPRVSGAVDGGLAAGGQAVYKLATPVGGSLELTLTSAANVNGNLNLQVLSTDGQKVLATGQPTGAAGPGEVEKISLAVEQDQEVLLQVAGVTTASVLVNGTPVTLNLGNPGPAINFVNPSNKVITLQVVGNAPQTIRVTNKNASNAAVGAPQNFVLQPGIPINVNLTAQLFDLQAVGTPGSGNFHLDFTNLDLFETALNSILFFPASGSPSGIIAGDVNRDARPDLLVTSNQLSNPVNVLLANGDGTFQSARQFDVGPGQVPSAIREPLLVDVNHDTIPDLIVTNFLSADVSVLLGRGDGTFAPQRRFDATFQADSAAAGDFNHDGDIDLAVLGRVPGSATLAILFGRGDGTFRPPQKIDIPLPAGEAFPVRAGDINEDQIDDLIVVSANSASFQVLLSNGNGSFTPAGIFPSGEITPDAKLADVNGDGKLDVVAAGANTGSVFISLGNGDGTFQNPLAVAAVTVTSGNISIIGLTVVDFASLVPQADGSTKIGPADNRPDLVVTVKPRTGTDAPQVIFLAGIPPDAAGNLFAAPRQLAVLKNAGKLAAGQFNDDTGDGKIDGQDSLDLAMADVGGVRVIYGQSPTIVPNTTLPNARDLGTVVHLVSQAMAIVPGFQDAFFKITVPREASPQAGDQVIDFSALFEFPEGQGLGMEVLNAQGQVVGTGQRFRIIARQGQELTVHVFGVNGGAGKYTLVIDVLPQVASVQGESLLSGANDQPVGAITSLVLTLQGDRLDPATAENPAHYLVRWLGDPGDATDDQIIPLAAAQPVVYNPGANVEVSSGRTFPTAIRQTITLLFDQALPEGAYQIELSAAIRTADFNPNEAGLLAFGDAFHGHPIVDIVGGQGNEGSVIRFNLLKPGPWGATDFVSFANGTPFLTQLHNDLGFTLDALLNKNGDNPGITGALNNQVLAKCLPTIQAEGSPPVNYLIIWLDPVSIDLADPGGNRAVFNLQNNTVSNNIARTFIEVGGNVQVLVMAAVSGTFTLNVADVQATARGGAVLLAPGQTQAVALTDALRGGKNSFTFDMGNPAGLLTSAVSFLTSEAIPISVATVTEVLTVPVLETLVLTSLAGVDSSGYLGEVNPDTLQILLAEIQELLAGFFSGSVDNSGIIFAGFGDVNWAGYGLGTMRSVIDTTLETLGLGTMPLPDLHFQETVNDVTRALLEAGAATASRLGTWIRSQLNGAPTSTPAENAPLPMPQPPPEEEEISLAESWPTSGPPAASADGARREPADQGLDGLVVAALFASGAFYGSLATEKTNAKSPPTTPRRKKTSCFAGA